ncbi:MAG TPA: hypothetical protein VE869_12480 [Gemmatimonas sp.]|nr:hypothetical protein [Gemmatimonas sp.]
MTPTQAAVQPPPAPTAPIAIPGAGAGAGSPATAATPVAGSTQIPPGGFTQEFVNALNRRKSLLSDQLSSAQGRRDEVAKDLRSARSGTERAGLEKRLEVLDNRLAQLETDIAANGQLLASAPSNLLARAGGAVTPSKDDGVGPFSSGQFTAVSIVFTLFVMAPLAMATARTMLKRFGQPKPAPQLLESSARLERMEQAVDAIAVEVERISEGQRFVTGIMAKRGEVPALAMQSADRQ